MTVKFEKFYVNYLFVHLLMRFNFVMEYYPETNAETFFKIIISIAKSSIMSIPARRQRFF